MNKKYSQSYLRCLSIMKHTLIIFCLFFFSPGLHALTINAGYLSKLCSSPDDSEKVSCILVIKGYMYGYIEGVAKGVINTYKLDPQIRSIMKDEKTKVMKPRVEKVINLSTCLKGVTIEDMITTYLQYIKNDPTVQNRHYREALTRAIEKYYCQK